MNIILNTYCNFKCPYCFADDVMTSKHNGNKEMNQENFLYVLEFMKKNNFNRIKLLGGEPVLHPQLTQYLSMIYNMGFKDVTIFSNMSFDKSITENLLLFKDKLNINIVPNWNIYNISDDAKQRMYDNLDILHSNGMVSNIGINVFRPDQDISEHIKLAKDYKLEIKYVITAPNKKQEEGFDLKAYGNQFYDILIRLFYECNKNNISIVVDCNTLPSCVFDDKQYRELTYRYPRIFDKKLCTPIIDVQPNLDVIHCFGAPKILKKINLRDYNKYDVLRDTIQNNLIKLKQKPLFKECNDCIVYKYTGFSCGCLGYKR